MFQATNPLLEHYQKLRSPHIATRPWLKVHSSASTTAIESSSYNTINHQRISCITRQYFKAPITSHCQSNTFFAASTTYSAPPTCQQREVLRRRANAISKPQTPSTIFHTAPPMQESEMGKVDYDKNFVYESVFTHEDGN